MPTNVTVSFDVQIDASGTINVFAQGPETVDNVIHADGKLDVSVLYTDASNAHIQFRGWSSTSPANTEDISGIRHNTFAVTKNAAGLAGYKLNDVITGDFDCSGAAPWKANYKNGGVPAYYSYGSFGDAMLGAYAHYLFGHVQATAAIDNDQAFVSYMNSDASGNAMVAARLLTALDAMNATQCTKVAKQVIGQDASRAMDTDNDMNSPNYYQALKFIQNDVIYMRVKLAAPTVTSGAAQLAAPAASKYSNAVSALPALTNTLGQDVYTLRIVLK